MLIVHKKPCDDIVANNGIHPTKEATAIINDADSTEKKPIFMHTNMTKNKTIKVKIDKCKINAIKNAYGKHYHIVTFIYKWQSLNPKVLIWFTTSSKIVDFKGNRLLTKGKEYRIAFNELDIDEFVNELNRGDDKVFFISNVKIEEEEI